MKRLISPSIVAKTACVALIGGGALVANAGLLNTTIRGGFDIFAPTAGGQNTSVGKSFIGGAGLEFGFGPVSVIGDVLYARRTFGIASVFNDTYNYLHIPVQAQLSLGLFHVSGGAYWAKGLGSVNRQVFGGAPASISYNTAGVSGTDFGAVAGLGVGIPLGVASLSVDLRYNLGLKDISTSTTSRKNRSFDLMAEFRSKLRRRATAPRTAAKRNAVRLRASGVR